MTRWIRNGRLLRQGRRAVLASACLFAAGTVPAGAWRTFAVDDSMSQVLSPAAQLIWRQPLPSRQAPPLLDARTDVRIVLNLTPWIGKTARIYMRMPVLPQSSLSVQWTTSGVLSPGRLTGGQRQLVFQGVVPGGRLEDTMHLTAIADSRDPVTPSRVNFSFEIEVPGP